MDRYAEAQTVKQCTSTLAGDCAISGLIVCNAHSSNWEAVLNVVSASARQLLMKTSPSPYWCLSLENWGIAKLRARNSESAGVAAPATTFKNLAGGSVGGAQAVEGHQESRRSSRRLSNARARVPVAPVVQGSRRSTRRSSPERRDRTEQARRKRAERSKALSDRLQKLHWDEQGASGERKKLKRQKTVK